MPKRLIVSIILVATSSVVFAETKTATDLVKDCRGGDDVSCTDLKSLCNKNPKKSAEACGLYGTYRFFDRDDESGYDKYILKACKVDKRFCGTKNEFRNLKLVLKATADCPKSSSYKTCVPLEDSCEKKNAQACRAIAAHWFNRYESEVGLPYLEKACSYGSQDSCDKIKLLTKLSNEGRARAEKQQQLENELQQRQIAVEEQKARTDAVNAFSNSVNMWNQQQNPPEPRQQRCRTVVRPGNEFHGTTATFETVCD